MNAYFDPKSGFNILLALSLLVCSIQSTLHVAYCLPRQFQNPPSLANSEICLAFLALSVDGSGGNSFAVGLPASSCRDLLPAALRGACVSSSSRTGVIVVAFELVLVSVSEEWPAGLLGQLSFSLNGAGEVGSAEGWVGGVWRLRRRRRKRKKAMVQRRMRRVETPMAIPAMVPALRWWW